MPSALELLKGSHSGGLTGLSAQDRTDEDKKAINDVMEYDKPSVEEAYIPKISNDTIVPQTTAAGAILQQNLRYAQHLQSLYEDELAKKQEEYGTDRSTVNESVNDYLDKIASEVSSHYKRFKGSDKLPISDQEYKELAAEYDARKKVRGEDAANIWLDKQFKNKVGENTSWWEQALDGIGHLGPTIEGGAIQAYGATVGALDYIVNGPSETQSQDINWINGLIDAAIDNPITRYGRDVEHAGTSHVLQGFTNLLGINDETAAERIAATKATATKYNPEGIGADQIILTEDQENSLISSATPGQALYSGGFTTLSMLIGAGEARLASGAFNLIAKGANWLNSTEKALKTADSLEKALVGLKKAQNFHNLFINPAIVGSTEGLVEGLSTKIEVENEAIRELDDFYKDKVNKEVKAILSDDKLNPMVEVPTDDGGKEYRRILDPNYIYQQVWDKYKEEYTDARKQINMAASLAGVGNFWANSAINGAINQTLKAGIMAPRVQETLRNSRLFGWAYKNPKFRVDENGVASPINSKIDLVKTLVKEPIGEGFEEYAQSLSNDTFAGAAENNIHEFIERRFDPDATVKVGETFSSDWGAAMEALTGSLTNMESLQSAVLGAVSSTMGTVGSVGRGYHRDENGKLVKNSIFDLRNFARGLDENGNQESWTEYARRVTPWRSGAVNAYFDYKKEMEEATETAEALTEWLKVPENRAKWDGLQGTASWMTRMESAAESNDQFDFRNSMMGKTINDVFMLQALEGTDFHDSVMEDLHRAADGNITEDQIQTIRQSSDAFNELSDEEVVEKIQSNANKMLGIMSSVEKEGKNIDRLLGRVDEDTKQSLIFGKLMRQDFTERRDKLKEEIEQKKGNIQNSVSSNKSGDTEEIIKLIATYGSINNALKAQEEVKEQKEKLDKKIEEIEAIDKKKRTDNQKNELIQDKRMSKALGRKLEEFNALYKKNEKGKSTGEVDSSLVHMVLNERDIMDLDPITRMRMLAKGAAKYYNATHKNQQKIDQLNLEIDELDAQIEKIEEQTAKWKTEEGKIKKGHNKQAVRNNKKVEELTKQRNEKLRTLNAEQSKLSTKPIYSQAQQEVIDNLAEQLLETDDDQDFLNKVIDMGRLEMAISNNRKEYQSILSDPKVFSNYVRRAKYNAQMDLTRRRAERVANIEDFQEYSQEIDRLLAGATPSEQSVIREVLYRNNEKRKKDWEAQNADLEENEKTELPKSNYERYQENLLNRVELTRQFQKNPNLNDNDMSLLEDAMEYLQSKGVDLTDREAAVTALTEKGETGEIGGNFRQWVEKKNNELSPERQAYMPQYTSIGQIVSDYVDILNGQKEDEINRRNLHPKVVQNNNQGQQATGTSNNNPTPSPSPSPTVSPTPQSGQTPESVAAGQALLNLGGSTPDAQQRDSHGQPIVINNTSQPQQPQQQAEQKQRAVDEYRDVIYDTIDGSDVEDEAKDTARQYFDSSDVTDTDELLADMQSKKDEFRQKRGNIFTKAAELLTRIGRLIEVKRVGGIPSNNAAPADPSTHSPFLQTSNVNKLKELFGDVWTVRFYQEHEIRKYVRNNPISYSPKGREGNIYFIVDPEWSTTVEREMNNGKGRNYNHLNDMPIVAAVKVKTPANNETTTAIEVPGAGWFQPIAILPVSNAKTTPGSAHTKKMREEADKLKLKAGDGPHLIMTEDQEGKHPLVTKVYGQNYRVGENPDNHRNNDPEDDNSLRLLVKNAAIEDNPTKAEELNNASRKDLAEMHAYQTEREKVLDNLVWNESKKQLEYEWDTMKTGRSVTSIVRKNPLNKTTDAATGTKTMLDLIHENNLDALKNFNSRVYGLFANICNAMATGGKVSENPKTNEANKIKVLSSVDLKNKSEDEKRALYRAEADKVERILNGYSSDVAYTSGLPGVRDFIYVDPSWHFEVGCPDALQEAAELSNSKIVFNIILVRGEKGQAGGEEIEIGSFEVTPKSGPQIIDDTQAKELLKNILYDSKNDTLRPQLLNWQVDKKDIEALKDKSNPSRLTTVRGKIGGMIDDGILMIAADHLKYDLDSIKLSPPFSSQTNSAVYREGVSNPNNAQPAAPLNVSPLAAGAVLTQSGQPVEPDSGMPLGDNKKADEPASRQKTPQEENAEKLVERIKADSARLSLRDDDKGYDEPVDSTGGKRTFLRVTSIIEADEEVPEYTTEEAKQRYLRGEKLGFYRWTPSKQEIYDQLQKENPSLPELEDEDIEDFKTSEEMAGKLGISLAEINHAAAVLRAKYNEEKFKEWGVPSTTIGDTMDTITRDFFNDALKDEYPNTTKEQVNNFVEQLKAFKADLDSKHITIVSEGIKASGSITITDKDGKEKNVLVAGTLDLFGYDDVGNFYIFDMKTVHDISPEKIEKNTEKWERQVSVYAQLLEQKYGKEFGIKAENIIKKIIPIGVSYPAPFGTTGGAKINGYLYERQGDQLMMWRKGTLPEEFREANPDLQSTTLDGQVPLRFRPLRLNWNNLDATNQNIAIVLEKESGTSGSASAAPQSAGIKNADGAYPQGGRKVVKGNVHVPMNGEPTELPSVEDLSNRLTAQDANWREAAQQLYHVIYNTKEDLDMNDRGAVAEFLEEYTDFIEKDDTREALKNAWDCFWKS